MERTPCLGSHQPETQRVEHEWFAEYINHSEELLIHQFAETSRSKMPIEERILIRHRKRQSDMDRFAFNSDA